MNGIGLKVYADYLPYSKIGGVGELALQMARHSVDYYDSVILRSTGKRCDGSAAELDNSGVEITYSGSTPMRGIIKGGVELITDCRRSDNQIILHQSSMAWALVLVKIVNAFSGCFRIRKPFPAVASVTTVFQTSHIHEFKNLSPYRINGVKIRPVWREVAERWTLVPLHFLLDLAGWFGSAEVVVVSEDHRVHFERRFGRFMKRPMRVAPNGFDASFARTRVSNVRVTETKPTEIIYVGVFRHRKRIRLLIEAVNQMYNEGRDVRLRLYGKAKSARTQRELDREIDGKDFITCEGEVSRSEISTVLDEADILCIPSSYEGLPVAMMEGLASGLVFVGARAWGMKDVMSPIDQNLLFEVDKVDSLKRALIHACNISQNDEFHLPHEFWRDFEWPVVARLMCGIS